MPAIARSGGSASAAHLPALTASHNESPRDQTTARVDEILEHAAGMNELRKLSADLGGVRSPTKRKSSRSSAALLDWNDPGSVAAVRAEYRDHAKAQVLREGV